MKYLTILFDLDGTLTRSEAGITRSALYAAEQMGYTGLSDVLLQKYIEDSAALWEGNVSELRTTQIGSVIGTHAGPGAIAVAFCKK